MNMDNDDIHIDLGKLLTQKYSVSPENKETIWDYEFCKHYFKCPLCGEKTLIGEAKHHTAETNRTLVGATYDKETYRVTYHNFRICKECDEKIKKGYFFAYLMWAVIGVLFYSLFAYIFFYTDDFCGSNYLLGPLDERSGWQFFFIFLGLTILGSGLALFFCMGICGRVYKSDIFLGWKYDDAYIGNAIAPMDEKDGED